MASVRQSAPVKKTRPVRRANVSLFPNFGIKAALESRGNESLLCLGALYKLAKRLYSAWLGTNKLKVKVDIQNPKCQE